LAEVWVAQTIDCESLSRPCSRRPLAISDIGHSDYTAENEPIFPIALLRLASLLDPNNQHPRILEAELLFYSGKHSAAAALVNEVPSRDYSSALLVPGRYENYIITAYDYFQREAWQAASTQFRTGLTIVGEAGLLEDQKSYYIAAVNQYSTITAMSIRDQLLAGKYSLLAGDWGSAVRWLKPLVFSNSDEEANAAANATRAWAALYLGSAYELSGDIDSAISAYSLGWEASKDVRLNGLRLLAILQHTGAREGRDELTSQLLAKGPTIPLGRSAVGYLETYPVSGPSGWTLVGYEVDPEGLSFGPLLELWLWWQTPENGMAQLPVDDGWISLGPYVVKKQSVTNLVYNPSFEWGQDANGIPLGWENRMYSDVPETLYIETIVRDDTESHVAVGDNASWPSSGLMGKPFKVQADGWYLMSGLMYTRGATNSNIGRSCFGENFQAAGPYYARWPASQVENKWVQISDFGRAHLNDEPDQCRLLIVSFENPGGLVMWDNLMLARVTWPAHK